MNLERERLAGSPFRRTGRFLSRAAQQVGERLPYASDYVSPASVAHQGILNRFRHRFGLAANILEEDDASRLEERSKRLASSMVSEGLVDSDTMVELRLILPEDSLWDPAIPAKSVNCLHQLQEVLEDEHDVSSVPNSHPIMPTKSADSPVSPSHVWGAIGSELEYFDRQMQTDSTCRKLAMLALTQQPYAKRIFDGQVFFDDRHLQDDVMVLRYVGNEPRENLLLPPRIRGADMDTIPPPATAPHEAL